jgi:hypothetical protein
MKAQRAPVKAPVGGNKGGTKPGATNQNGVQGGQSNQQVVVEQQADLTNPAMVEALADSAALGPATEINDLGPMQPYTQLDRMVDMSAPSSRNEEAVVLVEQALGYNLGNDTIIHLDRYASAVANTYNAEAVQLDKDVYVHRSIEEVVVEKLYPPQLFESAGPDTVVDELQEPDKRPPTARHEDSEIVVTPGNYTIEMKDSEVIIADSTGDIVTRIWGDPHVDEGGNGDNWHFGEDSSFILPDGTKICLDTEANSHGWWYVVGVDVVFGYTRYHYGVGGTNGMSSDGEEWDAAHADASDDKSAGIFFLQSNGQWARMGEDGSVRDVADESWAGYQGSKDVDVSAADAVGLTVPQWEALDQEQQIKIMEKYSRFAGQE